MITFKMDIILDLPFTVTDGRDVIWNIPGTRGVVPEKAIATGDWGPCGNIVEFTFRDDDHLMEWINDMGESREKIETLIGRPLVY